MAADDRVDALRAALVHRPARIGHHRRAGAASLAGDALHEAVLGIDILLGGPRAVEDKPAALAAARSEPGALRPRGPHLEEDPPAQPQVVARRPLGNGF